MFDREKVIETLIEDDSKVYSEMTDEELEKEYRDRFDMPDDEFWHN